jgi:hypothetical protein
MNAESADKLETQLLIRVIRAIRGRFLSLRLTISIFFGDYAQSKARQ